MFSITIRSFTYWGTSNQTHLNIHSPPSTPSEPSHLRYFIEDEDCFPSSNPLVSITMRWDPPKIPNGILQGYEVRCWFKDNETETDICDGVITSAFQTEYVLVHMNKHQEYFFQVHTCI